MKLSKAHEIRLEPFDIKDADLLIRWIPTEAFGLRWGGPLYSWPITRDQISAHINKKEVHPFWFITGNQTIGYIELVQDSPDTIRLCRVIISEEAGRGKGYGRQLVQQAVDYARDTLKSNRASLSVFEDNPAAVQCYTSIGFKTVSRLTGVRSYHGKDLPLLRMEMAL